MQDVVARFDACSYLAVALCLHVAVRHLARHAPRFAPGMVWAGVLTLLIIGGVGYGDVRPTRAIQVVGIAVVAWICSSSASLAALVLVAPLMTLHDRWQKRCIDRQREAQFRRDVQDQHAERERDAEQERQQAEARERETQRLETERPKPLTRGEQLAAAKATHDTALLLIGESGLAGAELGGALEKAKSEYLKALDRILSS